MGKLAKLVKLVVMARRFSHREVRPIHHIPDPPVMESCDSLRLYQREENTMQTITKQITGTAQIAQSTQGGMTVQSRIRAGATINHNQARIAGRSHLRAGATINHNQTGIAARTRVRAGGSFNHNQTGVAIRSKGRAGDGPGGTGTTNHNQNAAC